MATFTEKKEFIRWVLKRQQFKRRESVWILNYLLSHDEQLARVHFVDEAHYCPLSIVMSTTDSTGIPFRYYNGDQMTNDAEKAFHKMRTNTEKPLYIQINMDSKLHNDLMFLSALEENPHLPDYLDTSLKDQKLVEELINHVQKQQTESYYRAKIDAALDKKNKRSFNIWVKKLKTYQESQAEVAQ